MSALTRLVLDSMLARRLIGSVVRGLVDAENAVLFATWPYPPVRRDVPIELSICLVPGFHRVVFVRAVFALLEDLPSGAEILVADHGVARNVKRTLSDYSAIRYVTAPPGRDDAREGGWMNTLADAARGKRLLFVAPDTVANPHVVAHALDLVRDPSCAFPAVTGSVIDHAGHVGEAGGVADLGDDDEATSRRLRALGRHERTGDASGATRAALLIDRALFDFVGGCDGSEAFFAVENLCRRVIGAGVRLRFDPRLAVLDLATRAQSRRRRRHLLAERRASEDRVPGALPQWPRVDDPPAEAQYKSLRILVVEDRVPHPELGQGYPRSRLLLGALDEAGHRVMVYPLQNPAESTPSIYRDLPRHFAVLRGLGVAGLSGVLAEEGGKAFDLIVVARPHNMRTFCETVDRLPASIAAALPPVVYDAEAISASREISRRAVAADAPMSEHDANVLIDNEIALASRSAVVVAVSDGEREAFERRGIRRVVTLGHAAAATPTPTRFDARENFLFVGALLDPSTPNVDGLRWFVDAVWPLVRRRLSAVPPRLLVAGKTTDAIRRLFVGDGIDVLGMVPDLLPLYDRARVFVAPARFSAGIPLKVVEAAGHGLPVVASTQAAAQLRWTDGVELLTADTAERYADRCARLYEDEAQWQAIRTAALRAVEAQSSHRAFRRGVDTIVRMAMESRP